MTMMATSGTSTKTLALHGGTPVCEKPISPVSVQITEDDINAVVGVMRSGMLAQGKHCLALEEAFGKQTSARHMMTCANGTCALQLAYEPLIQPGDEVLVPAWTYIATVSMVVARGGIPVFCDVDPKTYNIDVADARRRITSKTTAIACTHLYGNPVDIDGVEKLAVDHALAVVYDAAQAHLATYKGRGLGEFGDAVTYSLYATKNMTTGEGGFISTNDDDLAKQIKLLRSHGETQKYIHGQVGYNYRMTDMEGALGLSQLQRLPANNVKRRANAAAFDRVIAGIPGLAAPTETAGAVGIYHLYPVRVDPTAFAKPADGSSVRDLFAKAMNAEGVATAIHYPRPVTRQPAFEKLVKDFPPVADRLAETLFCIPVHTGLNETQVKQIGEALNKVANALR
jgi:perosamine synthetase